MGIGRQQARALIDAVRTGTANRRRLREEIGDAINLLQDLTAKLDVQAAGAERDFAASRSAQFNTFVDALPEPPTDQTP
jgi:hypothetical protein